MDEGDNDEGIEAPLRFPLTASHEPQIRDIIGLIRSKVFRMSPYSLRSAASALLALERLPSITAGIDVTFGFRERGFDGNYAWADLHISDDFFLLKTGERFYGEGGGDTETRIDFKAIRGSDACAGSIEDWLIIARSIADEGFVSCEDRSDTDSFDWDT